MKPVRTLLLAVAVGLFIPLAAMAQVTSSNLGNASTSDNSLSAGLWRGGTFSTDGFGYTLDSVTIQIGSVSNASGNFFAAIYNSNGTALLETLSGTSNPSASTQATFLSSGLTLSANTTYAVLAGVTSGPGVYSWDSTSTSGNTGPWAIPFGYMFTFDQGASYGGAGAALKFSVTATAIPEPSVCSMLFGAAALGWVARRRISRARCILCWQSDR
jgi:hypothetical protein